MPIAIIRLKVRWISIDFSTRSSRWSLPSYSGQIPKKLSKRTGTLRNDRSWAMNLKRWRKGFFEKFLWLIFDKLIFVIFIIVTCDVAEKYKISRNIENVLQKFNSRISTTDRQICKELYIHPFLWSVYLILFKCFYVSHLWKIIKKKYVGNEKKMSERVQK